MSKSLLIVESPTKAKTIGRYLGNDFVVKASVGHVKDLPKSKLGIDLEKDFQPEYEVMRGKKKIIAELKKAAAAADVVYLGPDPDREGEAIAWHISEEIKAKNKPVYRVLFYELTRKAIQEALAKPDALNRDRYEAQQARRAMDRLVGYLISPVLWDKVKRGLSAGRVQSVALRLISEREKAIRAFNAEEYWTMDALLNSSGNGQDDPSRREFSARLLRHGKKKCSIGTGEEADTLRKILLPLTYRVDKVEKKKRHRNPAPPFITSTLQQEAARKLHFSARLTMGVAQKLYEGLELGKEGAVGLITYMRTDSTRLSNDAVQAVRTYVGDTWGKDYLPARQVVYKTREGAQDAHEAIRPTDVNRTPESVAGFLTKEQLKLYSLVWKRFVACQMSPAVIAQTTVDIGVGDYTFRAAGSIVEFPGFMTLYVESQENGESSEDGEGILPDLAEGQVLKLIDLKPSQHFTQPPPRFSEASLIKELEERGIGRPSTYASILSTILDREYVVLNKQRLYLSELGWIINELLVENFPNIVDVEFTAKMEKSLDDVEQGKHDYPSLISGFYDHFAKTLESARHNMLDMKREGWRTGEKCPQCERPLNIRWSRNGPFIACSAYPDCNFSSDYDRDEHGAIQLVKDQETGETCEKCGKPMLLKKGRFGAFLACSGYPECKNTRSRGSGLRCPMEGCDGELVERVGKAGRRFFGCNRYPGCKMAFSGQPVRKSCPACGASFLVQKENRRSGPRLVCVNPSCKHEEKEEARDGADNTKASS